jgi:hypothetical protein
MSIAWIAVQAGYGRTALYNATVTGYVTKRMADRVGAVFENVVQIERDHMTLSSFVGVDGHSRPRFARQPGDRRLRSAQASGDTSGANAPLAARGGPTQGPTIRIDVGRLLMKQLR